MYDPSCSLEASANSAGSKYDWRDMEVIILANTTRWAMDDQIHHYAAREMQKSAVENRKGAPICLPDRPKLFYGLSCL